MARRAVLTDARADSLAQVLVELDPRGEHDKQQHLERPLVAPRPRHIHHDRIEDLLECTCRAVDLAGAHAHALAVDGRVGAAVDDGAAARSDADPVAVAPCSRVHGEVALTQALADAILTRAIAPEEKRHRGHRLGHDELAHLVDQSAALLVPRLHGAPQRAALQFALVYGQQRAAAHERRADIGAAARRIQPHLGVYVLVYPAKALRCERRTGGADPAQHLQIIFAPRLDASLLRAGQQAGADPHARHARLLGEPEQDAEVRAPGPSLFE